MKVWPIGAMTYGAGSIGAASISTLSKDLRKKLTPGAIIDDADYVLHYDQYTIEDVAQKAARFLFATYKEKHPDGIPNYFLGYRLCGYSAGAELPEAWEVKILGDEVEGPEPLCGDDFGQRWAGETEAIDRLVLGVGSKTQDALQQLGLDEATAQNTTLELIKRLRAYLWLPAMPIQDAIDLARFLVEAASKFSHFSLRPATVGGAYIPHPHRALLASRHGTGERG